MNAEHDTLANAYLDGELTDEQRRDAEADPTVMAEVEQLRALRFAIADVAPSDDATRESAITAAMSTYLETYGAAPVTPTELPRVAAFRRHRQPAQWLSLAAAVAVIGLLGTVVVIGLRGGDPDDMDIAAVEPAAEMDIAADMDDHIDDADEDAAADSAGSFEIFAGDDDADAEAPALEQSDVATAEPADGAFDDADDAFEDTFEDTSAEEDASTESADEAVDAGAHLDGLPIETRAQLAVVGRHLLELDERRPTPNHSCPFLNVLGEAVYLDSESDAPQVDLVAVYIEVDERFGAVLAIDQDTCDVIADTDLAP